MERYYFEDFDIGQQFPLGPITITAEEIIEFATEFDPQPMHLSEEAGAASLLGGLAASGWHTSALLMRMMIDAYVLKCYGEGAPGIEFVEWKKPVMAGDTLSGHTTVEEMRPLRSRPGIGVVTTRHVLMNQSGDIVLTARNAAMIRMRATQEASQ
ncbi:MaoC family dehydratase [Rhizobium sp.]|uniref:MaoC family dehydratase n=1 Tax=Rhizobium sp. TaxID=391 RepID=UPI000E8B3581|nr:enoyl-CoA hydratase [Rhizobium sp.]